MAEFMLHHTHRAEDCDDMSAQLQNVAQSLKGKAFFCSCPSGDHGGFFRVEATSPAGALDALPPVMRATSTVYAGEDMDIPN